MPRREGLITRTMNMALPAAVVSFAAATLVGVVEGGPPWSLPGLFELIVPGLGVLFGVWVGMTLTRGLFATVFFLPKVGVLAVLLALVGGILAWRCLEPAPLSFDPVPVCATRNPHDSRKEKPRNCASPLVISIS
jgi:hypothetical protein